MSKKKQADTPEKETAAADTTPETASAADVQTEEAPDAANPDLLQTLEEKETELKEQADKYLRLLAEYDNFKKRTAREKESIYIDAAGDAILALLPVLDNLERALDTKDEKESPLYKGLELVYKQAKETFLKLGVKETPAVGEEFNPELHNAVMHIEDDTVTENTIVEQFQKGYTYQGKVLRYSMVKVAN